MLQEALSTIVKYPVLQQNPKALEAVWDYAYDRVGYLGTNTPIDRCYKCDFEGDFEPTEREDLLVPTVAIATLKQ